MKYALLLWLTLLLPQALAANLPQPYRYGFSADGEVHLLLTHWTQDGSGFPAASLRVVRQGVGVLLEDELVVQPQSDAEEAPTSVQVAEQLLARHGARLEALGLAQPIPGQPVWAQAVPLPALTGWPAQEPQRLTLQYLPGALKQVEVLPQVAYNTCAVADLLPESVSPVGLRLRVNGQNWFRDPLHLPEGRACVAGYRLEAVWQQGDAVAVLLRAYAPGFEGPDARPLTLLGRVTLQEGQP